MKLTHSSPVQYWFIHIQSRVFMHSDRHNAVLIKAVIKIRSELKGVNEIVLIKNESFEIDYKIWGEFQIVTFKLFINRILSHVRPFYEQAVSGLDRLMHRSLWVLVAHNSFMEGSHTTKNTVSDHLCTLVLTMIWSISQEVLRISPPPLTPK